MRHCKAIITVATGRHGTRQFPVQRVEQYATDQNIDSDADTFSLDIGDVDNKLALCLDRDNEVRVQLYVDDLLGRPQPIFKGIVDTAVRDTDYVLSMQGRDEPSSLAVDSDALPGRWRHVVPAQWIAQRAHALGISSTKIASMANIASYYTDGSEKEWAAWYRMARMRHMYMWTDNVGALIIDKLGYSLVPTYKFGMPPRGQSSSGWFPVEDAPQTSNKNTRVRRVLVYGMKGGSKGAKKKSLATAMVAQGIDTSIGAWKKQPTTILTSTTAKTQTELKKVADEEVFESIVGTQELTLTVRDTGVLIEQNKMALVNLPDHGIVMEPWFVVGVQRHGGPDGAVQIVRLREKGFAISKRVPDAPALQNAKDSATDKPVASIGAALAKQGSALGIRWADSFVKATHEFGTPAGWDFAVFLGVLLSICQHESSFQNEREKNANAVGNGEEWQDYQDWLNSGDRLTSKKSAAELLREYQETFANSAGNPLNPFRTRSSSAEAGVGPMQLTSAGYKDWADQYGWNGTPKVGEYDGGRWNPESNIRAAARALVEKLKTSPPADPTQADNIWIGVGRYNGGGPHDAYATAVKSLYDSTYGGAAASAVASVKSLPDGSAVRSFTIPGHGNLILPSAAPKEVAKAITWAMQRLGDPYEWGGTGPNYDCSSFVTAALAQAAPYLAKMLDRPVQATKHHGEDTYTLWKKGTAVTKDNLLPGDLIFFRGVPPEHVAMYIGDGLYIHDPQPHQGVSIGAIGDDWSRTNWSGARRYITWINRAD